jgi:intracellular sulfur oxidation DsrE/DsrF family protein
MLKNICAILIALSMLATPATYAAGYSNDEVADIIAGSEAPAGVVFEMTSWDDRAWEWAAPLIADLRRQLRERFPGLDVVVVSHGADQFQLTKDKQGEQPGAIAQLASLSDEGMNIHVCGVHSQWNDVPEDAYLDFVDVSASGPAQIRDYMNVGYVRIALERPE